MTTQTQAPSATQAQVAYQLWLLKDTAPRNLGKPLQCWFGGPTADYETVRETTNRVYAEQCLQRIRKANPTLEYELRTVQPIAAATGAQQ